MENEIKVNEYVRLENGEIFKIDENTANYYNSNKKFITNEIVKHSFNIIDIIEVGDYVNGHKILEIKRNVESGLRYLMYDYVPIKYYVERTANIETIVTKEMMESISYKVKTRRKIKNVLILNKNKKLLRIF